MNDVYESIHDYNSSRKIKILIDVDDMIADIMTNKKFQSIIKKLCIRCRKLNILLALLLNLIFPFQKMLDYLITKINSKREFQNIAINRSADIDYQDFIKIYRGCTKEPYHFLTIDKNPLRFRKNLFDSCKNDNNRPD